MPRIFDNLTPETQLVGGLRGSLEQAVRADFCVGYFNLRGWSRLATAVDELQGDDLPLCRVLVGMQRPGREEVELAFRFEPGTPPDQQTILRLKRQMAEEFREQLTIGKATNEAEAALRRLRAQIKAGRVQIKLYLRHPLHAKLYIIHRSDRVIPKIGFLGSSNLTFSGLEHQGELNIDVADQDAAEKLQRWFEDRWKDRRCLDISEDLVEIIDESWAREDLVPPYHVYLKMVYHLSQDARAGLTEFRIPRDFGAELFEFQKAAVKIAAHHVQQRGGVLIGDVVGLGKTLMASALARVLQDDEGTETVIICPPNLQPMWQSYIENHRLIARIVPLSRVIEELPELRRYRVVLIDESHNLRNPDGRRYKAIRDYVQQNDSRVILLSATPYNKAYVDLSAQLRLFVPEDQDIGIRPEALLREVGEAKFVQQHQCGLRTLRAFEKSEDADDWRNLMRRYLVRRTRGFIQEHYAERDANGRTYLTLENGRTFPFPTRVPKTVAFDFDASSDDPYPKLFSNDVVSVIDGLILPRYGLGNYVAKVPSSRLSPSEREEIRNLGRAGNRLIGFSRTNLFKRLESGGPAFLQSVERHILRNFIYLHALERGLDVPIGSVDVRDFDTQFNDSDDIDSGDAVTDAVRSEETFREIAARAYDRAKTEHARRFKWLRAGLFEPELARDLLSDSKALIGVLEKSGPWDAARDQKLRALQQLIQERHPTEKILIFTQYADTVAYLVEQLQRRGVEGVEGVTAGASDPTRLAWRFSPSSNRRESLAAREGEIRVLIATDVLSEGQNLQDAAIIVNFDLPWAIIRLIQRAGRIDRIGQASPEILCYSFLPADGLEQVINLRGRLRRRLSENAEVVGTDEAFFEDDGDDRPLVDLYNEKSGILDETEDVGVDPTSEAYQIWKNAIEANPKLQKIIEDLPDVVYASKEFDGDSFDPYGVLVFVRTPEGNDAMAWRDELGFTVSESPLEILRVAACEPKTPARPRAERHHEMVAKAVQHIVKEQTAAGGQLGRPTGARSRTYRVLTDYLDSLEGKKLPLEAPNVDALKLAIQDIYTFPLRSGATDRLNRMLRSDAPAPDIARAVIEMRDNDVLSIEDVVTELQEPRIICSMGLVPARQ